MNLYAILVIAAAAMEVILLAILRLGNLKAQAVEFIALALGASLVYIISVAIVSRLTDSRRLLLFVIASGVIFRATLFPLYPSLSDDLLRYRWEGKAQLAGVNPYLVAPQSPKAMGLRDVTWPAVNGKEFTTAYGPLTELIFRETFRIARHTGTVEGSVLLMKLPALIFDLGTALMLVLLLKRLRLPASRVLVYYWCPVAIVEFAASGHNDAIAVFFLMAALVAVESSRPPMALAALTASALAKVFAGLLAPALLVREWRCFISRGGRPLLWPVLVVAVVAGPFVLAGVPGVTLALAIGSGHWRNNDSLFGIVEWITGSMARASWTYMAVVVGTSIILAWKRVPLVRAAYLLIAVILVGAANCFPWYLTWILPLQAVFLNPAWLLLTATSALSYHILIGYQATGVWQDSALFRALEYVPFYALLLWKTRK